jgi:CobQ/CobB/MinD/ParA nucleotide binding domain
VTVRFDDALLAAVDLAADLRARLGMPVVVVRTVTGRSLLVVDDRSAPVSAEAETFDTDVSTGLGEWAGAPGVIYASGALAPTELLEAGPRLTVLSRSGESVPVQERMITGSDWLAPPLGRAMGNRVTTFGFKGGVGRTTAATALAVHAARSGLSVLMVDLDLESPGLGPSLLGRDLPRFGVVDHLVEDAVGQASDLPSEMVSELAIEDLGLEGRVLVAPARGSSGVAESYPAKLARAYVDAPPAGGAADRIHRAIEGLESAHSPDLTIIDSRAGLDVLAAIAVTRLGALSLLFGVDTPQTWAGYATLFQGWQGVNPELREFRRSFKAVASFLPEVGTDKAFASHRDHAQECFAEYLYDEQGPDDIDGFNFEPDDPEAPHYPLPIVWTEGLRAFNPLLDPSSLQAGVSWAALEPFCVQALGLVRGTS